MEHSQTSVARIPTVQWLKDTSEVAKKTPPPNIQDSIDNQVQYLLRAKGFDGMQDDLARQIIETKCGKNQAATINRKLACEK